MGSAAIALSALGISFFCVFVESDQLVAQALHSCFDHALHFDDVSAFHPDSLPCEWQALHFWLVLVVGSFRKQSATACNAALPFHVRRVADASQKIWADSCIWAMCESWSCDEGLVSANVSALLPIGPILTDAADWGHVSARHVWVLWCSRPEGCLLGSHDLIASKAFVSDEGISLGYFGKPWPKKPLFQEGFSRRSSDKLPPFEFLATASLGPQEHDENALVWKGDACRCLYPSEKAQLYGLPSDLLKAFHCQNDTVRASVVASSIHVPSIALVFSHALQCVPQVSRSLSAADEALLKKRVAGTVFQPGIVDSFAGLVCASQLAAALISRCNEHGLNFTKSRQDLVSALSQVNFAQLQVYWVDTQLRGRLPAPQGLDWAQQRNVAHTTVAVGLQRGSGNSRFAMPPLHPAGLTKEEHMQPSAATASPFAKPAPLDDDLDFACRALACLGPAVRNWRSLQMRLLTKLAQRLRPWERELVAMMPPSVAKVAATKRPFFMLACAILLRWPDETNPLRYVLGFDIVGDIEVSGLFRKLEVDETLVVGLPALLGPPAKDNQQAMLGRVRPSVHDEDLLRLTLEEVELGFADGPFSFEEMDAMFGPLQWRPLERFIHVQSCGKLRCIDSGKKPGHNSASRERETIYTCSVDVIPAIISAVFHYAQQFEVRGSCLGMPLQCVLGTEDMQHAYRQCPVNPEHRCCSSVAFWDHRSSSVKFIILNGLPFGLSSAVLSFNRTPALLTSIARRCCAAPAVFFFDDTGVVDAHFAQGSAQAAVRLVYSLAGALLDPSKSQPPGQCRTFLGLSINVASSEACVFDLKPGARVQINTFIDSVFAAARLTSGQAAKLRGKFGWAASSVYGKCGRGGQSALVQRQYFDVDEDLSPALLDSLLFHRKPTQLVPPRVVPLQPAPGPPVRIYSDASFEPDGAQIARLGFVVFPGHGRRPIGMSADIPPALLQLLVRRQQQITPCEALLGVVVPHNVGHLLRNREVIWYIDNQAACQALVKGSSSHADLCSIATLTHLLLAKLGCRVYFEYIESEANIADGLSRDGLEDNWTKSQHWDFAPAVIPTILYSALSSLHKALLLV